MNKTVRIADFSEMLATLTEKSKHGFKDIHTLQASKNFKHNLCKMFDGILFDGNDFQYQVVKVARLDTEGNVQIQKYFGNNEDSSDKELDSCIVAKVRYIGASPYIVVEVSGNGGRFYAYTIADGKCILNMERCHRTTD